MWWNIRCQWPDCHRARSGQWSMRFDASLVLSARACGEWCRGCGASLWAGGVRQRHRPASERTLSASLGRWADRLCGAPQGLGECRQVMAPARRRSCRRWRSRTRRERVATAVASIQRPIGPCGARDHVQNRRDERDHMGAGLVDRAAMMSRHDASALAPDDPSGAPGAVT